VTSFGDNVLYTLHALEKQTDQCVVILQSRRCRVDFDKAPNRIIICYETTNPLHWIRAIYHLATSNKVFIDTYYAFLAVTNFKKGVQCIQLWHAAGAMKRFGLEDLSIHNRSAVARRRFKEVYKRFNYVVIGSEKMHQIFHRSFDVNNHQVLRTGIPRTDFFFNDPEKAEVIANLTEDMPVIKDKKVILYAPTYRDKQLIVHDLALEIEKLYKEFKDDYVLFLSLHPAVHVDLQHDFIDFVYDVSSYHINHVSLVSDVLITDYSSIPFEFALLHKPIIFFAYDLEEYEQTRGLWDKYEHLVPGPIARNTDELIHILKYDEFNMGKLISFARDWNEYSNGNSSHQLIETIYQKQN
jgi:teichoic acid glycerol-phosphate primase